MNKSSIIIWLLFASVAPAAMAQDSNWWQSNSQATASQQASTNETSSIVVKPALIQSILVRLKSPDENVRIGASRNMVYGKGITDKDVYAAVAEALEYGIANPRKSSDDEIAWHALALSSSGDAAYLPALENLIKLKITRHAQRARDELLRNMAAGGPVASPAKISGKPILMTESQSQNPSCRLISQETCNTSRGEAKCIAWHQDRAGQAGANALLLINSSTTPSTSVTSFVPIGNNLIAAGGTSKKTTLIANYYHCDF